jgi:hypothetical protein
MAITLVVISGKVVAPDGVAIPSGVIRAKLQPVPGSTLDGGVSQRAATEANGTITAGTVAMSICPNDAITPSGTYYVAVYDCKGANGKAYRWSEKWQLTSADLTLDIGAVPRLDVVPGVALEAVVPTSVAASISASAQTASTQSAQAVVSAAAALASQAAAELARDAANALGRVYVDEPTGRAASTDGQYFSVPVVAGSDSLILYRRVNAGSSTEVNRYPASAAVLGVQRNIPSVLGAQLRTAPGAVTTLRAKGREAFTVVRSTAGEVWANGARVSCGANTARISDDPWGILIEQARTNYVANPTAPTNQTTASLGTGTYSVDIEGTGQVVVTAGTATGTGFPLTVTGRTPGTFTITVAGTVVLTYSGSVSFAQVVNAPMRLSRLTTTGAASADVVSVSNPLAGKGGAWHIDCVVELARAWSGAEYKQVWQLGPLSGANRASLVLVANSIYLEIYDGSNAQKFCISSSNNSLDSNLRHRFTAGADEDGVPFVWIDGEVVELTVSGAGSGVIAVQPATLYLGSGSAGGSSINGVMRDFEVRAGEPQTVEVKRPRYLLGGDSIFAQSALKDAIKDALAPHVVPQIDSFAVGGDTMGSAFMWLADKHFYFSGGTYGPTGKWIEQQRAVPLSAYGALIVEYGRNETSHPGMTAALYWQLYDKIISQAFKLGIRRVMAGNPPPIAAADLLSWGSEPYNATWRNYLALHWAKYNLRPLDTWGVFTDLVARGVKSIADLMSDTGHANTVAGTADMARRIAIGLVEKARPSNRKQGGTAVTPLIPGTVRTYFGGSQVTGDWSREYLDTETHANLNGSGMPGLQMMPLLVGRREQAMHATQVGSRLIWPAAKATQIWLHYVFDASGGGTVDAYCDRGTGSQTLRSIGMNFGSELFHSTLLAEGLTAGVDHTPEIQITGGGPVNIVGVTYVGGD